MVSGEIEIAVTLIEASWLVDGRTAIQMTTPKISAAAENPSFAPGLKALRAAGTGIGCGNATRSGPAEGMVGRREGALGTRGETARAAAVAAIFDPCLTGTCWIGGTEDRSEERRVGKE